MKRPTNPPKPPGPYGPDGPSSGRARKDVNYIPSAAPVPPQPRSVSPLRAPPPLPSTRTAAADEYEMMEDLATPMRHAGPAAAPLFDPITGPAAPGSVRELAARPSAPTGQWEGAPMQSGPFPTGPMQPLPMPPTSSRNPANFGPSSQQALQASSGRMRQSTPMDTPMYAASQPSLGPISNSPMSGHQITGPQMPVPQRPTGSDPSYSSVPSRRATADDGVPLGYVVASAFFLAIALVGFGLYLAFEVF